MLEKNNSFKESRDYQNAWGGPVFESLYKTRKNRLINYFGFGLFVFICLMFVFTGNSPNVSFLGNSSVVAQVNNETIGLNEFNRVFERVQEGNKKKLSADERKKLQKEALDTLVNRALILNQAKEQGVFISPSEIADFLMQIPQFQEKGQFSLLRYKELLKGQALNESLFEQKIADDLLVQKMNTFYEQATGESQWLQNHEDEVGKTSLNLSFVRWPLDKLSQSATVTDEEVAVYAQKNESQLKKEYDLQKDTTFTEPEQVQAQHILIKTSPQMTEEKALAKIKEIAAQIKDNNFADLAKKYSDDPGSKAQGGDLGFFAKGRMVKEFEAAAFSLEKGKISEPVKTSYGYHIIKVNDKKEGRTISFDEAKLNLARQKAKAEKNVAAVSEFRQQVAKASDAEVLDLVTKKGGAWEETGAFTLNDMSIPKIGGSIFDSDALLQAAVKLSVKNQISKDLIEKEGFVYLVRYNASKLNAVSSKANNMDFFKQIMARQEAFELFQSWMQQLRQDAKVHVNNKLLSLN